MTQEDKQLLIKDLCARLPHGVKAICDVSPNEMFDELRQNNGRECFIDINSINGDKIEFRDEEGYVDWWMPICYIRPYLRPMSSMTESEIDRLFDTLHIDKNGNDEDWIKINDVLGIKFFFPTGKWVENVAEAYDYLNSIHVDYRGLISMSLALEAPEGMYKTE